MSASGSKEILLLKINPVTASITFWKWDIAEHYKIKMSNLPNRQYGASSLEEFQ